MPVESGARPKVQPKYCLVGGTGRSGTTVPGEVFARRRDVAWPEEARFLTDPDGIIDFYQTFSTGWWSPNGYSRRVRRLLRVLRGCGKRRFVPATIVRGFRTLGLTKKFPFIFVPAYGEVGIEHLCPGYGKLVDRLAGDLVEFSFPARYCGSQMFEPTQMLYRTPFEPDELRRLLGSFVRDVLDTMAAENGATAVIEDSPWNFLFFDKILELLPEARMVHVYRDPRDVVASFRQQQWSPSDPVKAAHWYCGMMQQWRRVKARIPTHSYIEISLEELCNERERVMRLLADFWGLEWDDVVLGADLSRSHTGRWKREFSPEEQRAVSEIVAYELETLGYQ